MVASGLETVKPNLKPVSLDSLKVFALLFHNIIIFSMYSPTSRWREAPNGGDGAEIRLAGLWQSCHTLLYFGPCSSRIQNPYAEEFSRYFMSAILPIHWKCLHPKMFWKMERSNGKIYWRIYITWVTVDSWN